MTKENKLKKLSKRQKHILGHTMELFKDGKIDMGQVYVTLIKYRVMCGGVLKVSQINTEMMKKLGTKTTIILK